MNVTVITLTRDRKELTRRCLDSIRASGQRFRHIVIDQGSMDGTVEFVRQAHPTAEVVEAGENLGISVGFNRGLELARDADYVLTVDNDCEFITKRWLAKLIRAQKVLAAKDKRAVVSPRVKNLKHPPAVYAAYRGDGFTFGFAEILGGICRLMPKSVAREFRFNERLPMAYGQDQQFAGWCQERSIPMAYVEDIIVRHMMTDDEQETAMPEYMRRKGFELYIPYGL